MRTLILEIDFAGSPLALARKIRRERRAVLLASTPSPTNDNRFSFVACRPFAELECRGSRCVLRTGDRRVTHFGNPWRLLDQLLRRYETLEERDLPFPLGGIFGWWGYELNRSLYSRLNSRAARDPNVPDLSLGFYDSLCVFDHPLNKRWIVSSGMRPDGSRSPSFARRQADWWRRQWESPFESPTGNSRAAANANCRSNMSRSAFIRRVERAREYIHAGDVYQINLSHRLAQPYAGDSFAMFERLIDVSPAPFAAWLDCGRIRLASTSPESFLKISGRHIRTRPIKGTRPRNADPNRDAQAAEELLASSKERAELIMVTDLLRNDLGRICDYGSVSVPELIRLERFPQVHHLVSTVEGELRESLSHVQALAACFPGGSVTGTPKLRAMQLIDELEPLARGPYTGALGFIGFNRETHLSVGIRTACHLGQRLFFNVGAGIVADSDPEAEYEETLIKARGFLTALRAEEQPTDRSVFSPGRGS